MVEKPFLRGRFLILIELHTTQELKKKKSKFKNRSNVMSLHRIHNQSSTVMLEIGFKEKGKL